MAPVDRLGNIVLALIALLLLVLVVQNVKTPVLAPGGGMHAVVLSNGQTFYGHLGDLGSPYPEMTDVFLIQHIVDPKSGQSRNVLVRRRGSLHAPALTRINANNIVVIEPVHPQSKMASLLKQMEGRNAAILTAKGELLDAPVNGAQ